MHKRPTKQELRAQLEQDMADFLQHGGNVQHMPRGASGLFEGRYGQALSFERKEETRTPVDDVIAAIDQRKEQKKQKLPKRQVQSSQKKIIYDDFGEPIRIIWNN